jgi:hypothetical protein
MVRPPVLNIFDQSEELAVEENESFDDLLRSLNFGVVMRREHYRQRWLRRAFKQVLAFLVEARRDGIVLLEDNQEGREGSRVVVAVTQVSS